MPSPRLLFPPRSRQELQRGFHKLARLMEISLGPKGRLVAFTDEHPNRPLGLLNDGATIARRLHSLPGRAESMGALLARQIAWQMEEAVGDGATTAVVLAAQVLKGTEPLLAAGHNGMELRRGLAVGTRALVQALRAQARPLDSAAQITALATAIAGDETLGRYIEEIFDIVGEFGSVDVRTNYGRGHDRQYIQGTHWNNGWASSYFTTEGGTAVVKDPYLLLTNRHLTAVSELLPILELVRQQDDRGLVVIATSIEQDALNLLVANKARQGLPSLSIKAPGLGSEKREILQDLAVLTGGQLWAAESGTGPTEITLADLGQADEVQAIRSSFTVVGGRGRPPAIRHRIAELRKQAPQETGRERERLCERAGKLQGGVALLKVGAATAAERDYLKTRAIEAVSSVRLGLQCGVAPGGGIAYLNCLPALESLSLPNAQQPALQILRQALAAPAAAILRNSGYETAPILARLQSEPPGWGFDVMRAEFADMVAAHIVDPVDILIRALQIGVSGALMAFTTDVLVHKPRLTRDKEVELTP